MNPYWQAEMRRNADKQRRLMSGPGSTFYRKWKRCGSPNATDEDLAEAEGRLSTGGQFRAELVDDRPHMDN